MHENKAGADSCGCAFFGFVGVLWAQDLGPQIKDGIYVYVGKDFNSNCGVILTQDGVVLIDSGHNPTSMLLAR
jgi:hypothetical protein